MEPLFDHEFLRQLPAMKFCAAASQSSQLSGQRKSNAKGSSVEFSDFREYLPGDDIRRLDWNAYARLGKLYMKLYREEKEAFFSVYVDLSPSMNYGGKVKARQALRLTAVFAYMALTNQDRIRISLCGLPESGFSANGLSVPVSQSFHGSAAFQRVLAWLEQVEQARQDREQARVRGDQKAGRSRGMERSHETEQGRGMERGRETERRRETGRSRETERLRTVEQSSEIWDMIRRNPPPTGGTSILLSDFMPEDVTETVKFLKLYRKQNVLLFQVLAEEELRPDWEEYRLRKLIDMEDGKDLRIIFSDNLQRSYQKELQKLIQSLRETAARYQGYYQCVSTGEPATAFLYQGANRYWNVD